MKFIFNLSITFALSLPVFAQIQTESLVLAKTKPQVDKAKKSALFLLKQNERNKEWLKCSTAAAKQFKSHPLIQPWILHTWLRCSRNIEDASAKTKQLRQVLSVLDKNKQLLVHSVSRPFLLQEIPKARIDLAELEIKDMKAAKAPDPVELKKLFANVDQLLLSNDRMERENRAKAYYFLAELSLLSKEVKAARQFILQSLAEKETKIASDRLRSIRLQLGESETEPLKRQTEVVVAEQERNLEEKLEKSVDASQPISYLEDAINYLNRYPNGRKAKVIQEKCMEIYSQIFDRSLNANGDQEKYLQMKERALEVMEKVNPLRAFDWSRSLHRRNDYTASLRLVEKALPVVQHSSQSALAFYIAGRSSQLLGYYGKAQRYFEQYIEHNSGGEDIVEVLFRLGLVHIRLGQYSSALANFEKIITMPDNDRYELSSRYWIVRILEKQGNPRFEAEAALIREKYPYSYYGIRLAAEKNQGKFEWSVANVQNEMKSDFYLTENQSQTFKAIDLLTENDWLFEAQKEISAITIPKDAQVKALMAHRWAKSKAYPMVIKLLNEAGDQDPQLRSLDLVGVGFPAEFEEYISKEAKKHNLHPILVRSLIRQESAFGVYAVSVSNALGLMQLIPPTAQEVAQDLKLGRISIPDDVFEPNTNIQMGTYYIAKMIKQYGNNVPLGLAAYNAGPHRLKSFVTSRPEMMEYMKNPSSKPFDEIWFDEIPWMETSFYVKAILRNSILYKAIDQGKVQLEPLIWADLLQNIKNPTRL